MVLSIGIEWLLGIYLFLVCTHILFILIGNHWINDVNFIGKLVFILLSPFFLWITLYTYWQDIAERHETMKMLLISFIEACSVSGITFITEEDAAKTLQYIVDTCGEGNYVNLPIILEELEQENVVINCDTNGKCYKFNEK